MPEIRYDKLSIQLEKLIIEGVFRNKLPGIRVLAKHLDANHITVRKAVELLIEKGLVEVIPYRGTFIRENEKQVRNFHVIGCIGVNCDSTARESLFNEQCDLIRESGYKILDITASANIFRKNPHLLLQFPVDGYIFFGSSLSRPIIQLLQENQIPFISGINRNFSSINQVGMDHISGYKESLRALKKQGCRRIAFLGFQRHEDFQSYLEDIRQIFIQELGPDFDPRLFTVVSPSGTLHLDRENNKFSLSEKFACFSEEAPPDGLITCAELAFLAGKLLPACKVAIFAPFGVSYEQFLVMQENLPELLQCAVRRMLELFSGDRSVTESRIPFIRKDPSVPDWQRDS